MIFFRKTKIILALFLLSACKYNPYGAGFKDSASQSCTRIIESTQRANCYERANESYSKIQDRMDKVKKEEREKEKLDFKQKKEPLLKNDNLKL